MFKKGEENEILKVLSPLLPSACIMLHLKVCLQVAEFGDSEILQFTLLPKLNACTDYIFLQNSNLDK